ncbi:hypothetical protein DM860_008510 [Cuscuta australis]|uniref:Uncharacterized protein n=1 Tax=Cuscuta australis TaxID=267555 RepID=A0A328D4S8_9ASTE|nr:hypothetical protein DM860_008510 [Cuscuta australis]
MIKEAVELYAYAMAVVGKDLDMDRFQKVLRVSKESEKLLARSTLDSVLKSLSSNGRWEECN